MFGNISGAVYSFGGAVGPLVPLSVIFFAIAMIRLATGKRRRNEGIALLAFGILGGVGYVAYRLL